jgi:hypothetical protein
VPHKPVKGPSRGSETTTSQIHVVIEALVGNSTGGASILSYEIIYDRGSNGQEWQELKGFSSNDATLFAVRSGLIISTEYQVRYRAKNVFGWSDYSDPTSIFTIMVPDQVAQLTT